MINDGGAPAVPESWAMSPDEVLRKLSVDAESGLDTAEARRRRRHYGLNRLRQKPPKRALRILLEQFRSLIVVLLAAAGLAAFAYGHLTEAAAILGVIVLNSLIGFFTELRAVRSMEALRRLSVVMVNVRRRGRVSTIPARGLVPGDVVILEAGDVASADLRLFEASKLQCNESILTGESLPVSKTVEPVDADTPLHDRSNMVYLGTSITRGSGAGVVVATGNATELGGIARLMEQAESGPSPLERRIDQLSRQLMWVALVLAAIIGVTGVATGRDTLLMIESAIALAVATVPEGLPMVATLALARGMWRMAKREALIERLAAVETLGATTVILTDKTGTLTMNEMAVARVLLATGEEIPVPSAAEQVPDGVGAEAGVHGECLQRLLDTAALCNNASLIGGDPVGDPMEVALLQFAEQLGVSRESLLERLPEVHEVAFEADTKMMATIHRAGENNFVYAVKGAPESVLAHVGEVPTGAKPATDWHRQAEEMARDGLRVLALAGKSASSPDELPYENLTLYGLLGLADPAREDVPEAISRCQEAGVRVVMVTGDHGATARNIAVATGIVDSEQATVVDGADLGDEAHGRSDAAIFARVTPGQKLGIISAFQERGEIVAMTGDGVNDAPALKKADIGVAMGRRGSQVAREAADMVLLDDRFGTIVGAIAQGRVIFGNIRKFVIYLMSCNVSELLTIGVASLSGAPLPLLPLQILYLNLVTDVFPAFALGAGEGERDLMRQPPRSPDEPLLAGRHWRDIVVGATFITGATLAAFALALLVFELSPGGAVTVSFLTLALAQLWHVFNMRATGAHWLVNEITRNRFVWGAIGLCLLLIVTPVYWPPAASILGLTPPPPEALASALALSFVPLVLGQLSRLIVNVRAR